MLYKNHVTKLANKNDLKENKIQRSERSRRVSKSKKNRKLFIRKIDCKNEVFTDIMTLPRCPFYWKIDNFKKEFEAAKATNKMLTSDELMHVQACFPLSKIIT